MAFDSEPVPVQQTFRTTGGISRRPAFTHLASLVCSNPDIAAMLLQDPIAAAVQDKMYKVTLNEQDRLDLLAIKARVSTVEEFLAALAALADEPIPD